MQLEYVNINPPQPMDKLTVDGGNGNGSAKNKRMQAGKILRYCQQNMEFYDDIKYKLVIMRKGKPKDRS